MIRLLSISLAFLGMVILAFLCFWYWEIFLWLILAPLAVTSLYLSWRLWWLTQSSPRAVIYWAVSLMWVLSLVIVFFQDVTVVGGVIAILLTLVLVVLVYGYVQKSITSA